MILFSVFGTLHKFAFSINVCNNIYSVITFIKYRNRVKSGWVGSLNMPENVFLIWGTSFFLHRKICFFIFSDAYQLYIVFFVNVFLWIFFVWLVIVYLIFWVIDWFFCFFRTFPIIQFFANIIDDIIIIIFFVRQFKLFRVITVGYRVNYVIDIIFSDHLKVKTNRINNEFSMMIFLLLYDNLRS